MTLEPLRDYVLCEALPDTPKSKLLVTLSAPNTARHAAEAFLAQDARYDDLTDECAAAKRALAHATRSA